MIDKHGFRSNVGIIITNNNKQVFWAKRIGQAEWQFPQGGLDKGETPRQAMYRELFEETGLEPNDVEVLASTKGWLRYHLPKKMIRKPRGRGRVCIGQKQVWFLLRLVTDESKVDFKATAKPEFDDYCWSDYWSPSVEVIHFKRQVYLNALKELAPNLLNNPEPPRGIVQAVESITRV